MKPLCKINCQWRPNLAYAIGLIATDGNLSSDGRHINLTSKDNEQLHNFLKCLEITAKIGYKRSSYSQSLIAYVQFGDINFYKFLLSIGLTPAKTKTISGLKVPSEYFFDFLRGHHDGDGTFYSYWDPRWRSSYMFYTLFVSASKSHIKWIQNKNQQMIGIKGYITATKNRNKSSIYQLRYAKSESVRLIPKMYYSDSIVCLQRKFLKIKNALQVQEKYARVL